MSAVELSDVIMPRRSKRRVRGQDRTGESRESNGSIGEQTGNIDNITLQQMSQRMDEFQNTLRQLSAERLNERIESSGNVQNSHQTIRQESISTIASGSVANSETRNLYVIQPSVAKPSFDGKPFANPIAFLKRLKKYIREVNGQDREIDIALGCITGHARKLMEMYSRRWNTFSDFEDDFRRTYWTEQIQESVRYRLINTVYTSESAISMSEHFAEYVESMQSLTISFSERDLVNSIMRHYPLDVQRLWFTRAEEPTIMKGANFLRSIEQNVVVGQREIGRYARERGNNQRGRYSRTQTDYPVAATILAERWRGRGGSTRGRAHRRGRIGYGSYSNRNTSRSNVLGEINTRPAITFMKEGEGSTLSTSVREDKTKN